MRGVLVDPYAETVTDVEYDGDINSMYKILRVNIVEVAPMADGEDMWVDEEGLLTVTADTKFIVSSLYHQPLAGRGLILSTDDDGETTASKHDAEYYRGMFQFLTAAQVRSAVL
jgi:hypothetical protein